MQLRVARLCMDCEELHDQQQCPVCASESFAYVSRWVPVRERRFQPRAPTTPAAAPPSSGPSKTRTATYGVMGLALAGAAGWWLKSRKKLEAVAERGAGELK